MVFEFAKENFSEEGWKEFLKEVHRNDNGASEDNMNPSFVEKITIHTHDNFHDIDYGMSLQYTTYLNRSLYGGSAL